MVGTWYGVQNLTRQITDENVDSRNYYGMESREGSIVQAGEEGEGKPK